MAILDLFEATIQLENSSESAPEYEDEELTAAVADSPIPTVAKFIEVEAGKPFSVRMCMRSGYRFDPTFNGLSWTVHLDGKEMRGTVITSEKYQRQRMYEMNVDKVRVIHNGSSMSQKFLFHDLNITQDNVEKDAKSLMESFKTLGTVEVWIWRYFHQGLNRQKCSTQQSTEFENSIPEKALKGRAITLGAGLGTPVSCSPAASFSGYRVDQTPIIRFIFHCRSKKSLQDMLVIPRDNTPGDDTARDDDLEHMTAEQLRELLRQKRAQENTAVKDEKSKVKREIEVHDLGDDDDVDEILEIRSKKRAKVTSTEVIELDSD